ncbi:EscU/YscU/HrcU family type III secretion system export apparatus switch protein [Oxalobacteraceae bacterium CAVE-383]|nr:EscU/YscU/HrcU family type III secretion system export apparatus switch protein [Oxalobacteraceae bacterium CAVE-383]
MAGEKTELPTEKKRRDSARKGQSFKSRDLVVAVMLLCGVCVVTAHASAVGLMEILMAAIEDGFRQDPAQYATGLLLKLAGLAVPILMACIVATALPSLYQSKFVLATESLGLKFESLNPVNGFKKLFSMRTLKDFVKAILYLLAFALAAALFWEMQKGTIVGLIHAQAGAMLGLWAKLLLALVLTCLACIALIIAVDVLCEIFLLTKDLKMEKQEVKREHKEQEGNPEVKAKRRELHMELIDSQLKSDIEKSSFVVVNPTHIAVAVYFKPEVVPFPFISAIELDHKALMVKAYAKKVGVPVVENIPLARRLFKKYKRYSFIDVAEIEEIMRILIWLMQVEDAAIADRLGVSAVEDVEAEAEAEAADEEAGDPTDAIADAGGANKDSL